MTLCVGAPPERAEIEEAEEDAWEGEADSDEEEEEAEGECEWLPPLLPPCECPDVRLCAEGKLKCALPPAPPPPTGVGCALPPL